MITKRDLIARREKHNIETWRNDPIHQELYALATNPNRTAADDKRFYELRDQQRKRDYEDLGFNSTEPVKEYPTQAETQAARFLDFATGSKRWRNKN